MALPEPSSNEDKKSKGVDQEDKDFDPTPEAFIDEIDDERTLEEEEALDGNNGTAVQEELDDLKKESEMPIEELLAYYERMRNEAAQAGDDSEEEDMEEEDDDEDEEEDDDDEGEHEHRDHDGARRGGDDGSGKNPGPQSDNNQPSADSTSQSQQQSKTSDTKQSKISSDKTNPSQHALSHQKLTYQNDDLTHSQAHSTTASIEQTTEKQLVTGSQTEEAVVTDSAALGQSNEIASPQQRHRRPMTDFGATDESHDIFKSLLGYDLDDSDDLDEDYSYTDDECADERGWRRSIHIGPEHQADIPESLTEYDDLPPYENEDKLVWNCSSTLTHERILEYLKQASALAKRNDISISPASVPKISSDNMRLYREKMQDITTSTSSHTIEHNHEKALIEHPLESLPDVYMSQSRKRVRIDYELEQENAMDGINQSSGIAPSHISSLREDNSDSTSQETRPEISTEEYFQDEEQLLYLLLQCNYNLDEALRRRKLDPFKYYFHEPMSLWSQEECLGFEHGLRTHGKDFRSIRENRVQTRTHAEIVAFYYLWKKSERHDVYTNQYKLDRKRCLSHPGTTDYMDKFIEDNESALNASSSSPTPTPTESTYGVNSTANTTNENNSTSMLYHSNESRPSIQYVNLPPLPTTQINHLQLHCNNIDDNSEQMNSPQIDSNTTL